MSLVHGLQIVCAVSIVLAAVALLLAAFGHEIQRVTIGISIATGILATASWVLFAFRPETDLAVSATGATAAFVASIGAIALTVGLERARKLERELEGGRTLLRTQFDSEVRSRVGELEHILARARADSSSQLAEQERALAETRRHTITEAEQAIQEKLAKMLAATQHDVEERIEGWQRDLGRSETAISLEVSDLVRGLQGMVQQTRARLEADGERISAESEEQRALIGHLREEMSESIEKALAANQDELEKFANERRRAIQEINERLGRREHELLERIEREETEVQRRIQAGVAEIERRQLEQLQRFAERTVTSVSDNHASQFDDAMREAREEAARRLHRELERGVETFSRRAEATLGDRMQTLGDESAKKMEARMNSGLQELSAQAEQRWAALEKRVADFELELRARLQNLGSETEGTRQALEARVRRLHHLLDEPGGNAGPRE